MIRSTLLISTYNWPEALELCLRSVAAQSLKVGEIIICDDGSSRETKNLINQLRDSLNLPIVHIWHPDEGFRLASIRNQGIAAAKGEYIIQIDGDLILHKHFIRDHIRFSRKNCFVSGSRVLLSEEISKRIFNSGLPDTRNMRMGNKNWLNAIHLPIMHNFLGGHYKNRGKHKYYVKGCNMAFWKSDLLNVNGYNEDIIGWGREDSELAIRLINIGIKKRFLKFGGVCYHLYHKEASRNMEEMNSKIMTESAQSGKTAIVNGLNKYLQPA